MDYIETSMGNNLLAHSTRLLRQFINWVKSNSLRENYLLTSYLLFVAGFFFFKEVETHNNFFYIFVMVPYVLTISRSSFKHSLRSPIFKTVLLIFGYLLVTLFWSVKNPPWEYMKEINVFIATTTFFALTCELELGMKGFRDLLFIGIFFVAALAASIAFSNYYHVILQNPVRLNDFGVLRNAVQAGNVYGMIIVAVYFSIIQKRSFMKGWPFLLLLLFMVSFFILLIQSRGPLIGVFVTLLLGGLFTRDSNLLFVLCCVTLASAILLVTNNQFLYDLIITRQDSYRFEIFRHTISLIQQKPIFGYGVLANYSYKLSVGNIIMTHPHNLYLAMWYYGGLVGLFLLSILILQIFWRGLTVFFRTRDFTYIGLVLYSSICVFTGNSQIVDHPTPLLLFYWMPIALISAYEVRMKSSVDNYETDTLHMNQHKKHLGAR